MSELQVLKLINLSMSKIVDSGALKKIFTFNIIIMIFEGY